MHELEGTQYLIDNAYYLVWSQLAKLVNDEGAQVVVEILLHHEDAGVVRVGVAAVTNQEVEELGHVALSLLH